jgi:hypothetical protein
MVRWTSAGAAGAPVATAPETRPPVNTKNGPFCSSIRSERYRGDRRPARRRGQSGTAESSWNRCPDQLRPPRLGPSRAARGSRETRAIGRLIFVYALNEISAFMLAGRFSFFPPIEGKRGGRGPRRSCRILSFRRHQSHPADGFSRASCNSRVCRAIRSVSLRLRLTPFSRRGNAAASHSVLRVAAVTTGPSSRSHVERLRSAPLMDRNRSENNMGRGSVDKSGSGEWAVGNRQ